MDISSIDKTVREVLKSNYYKIPRFQRPYSWEREHIDDFLNDVIVDSDSDYFIGSMVVFRINEETYGVVDGRQAHYDHNDSGGSKRVFQDNWRRHLAKRIQGMIERKDLDDEMRYVIQTETR